MLHKGRLLDYWGFFKNSNEYVCILTVIVVGVCNWRSISFQSLFVKKNMRILLLFILLYIVWVCTCDFGGDGQMSEVFKMKYNV